MAVLGVGSNSPLVNYSTYSDPNKMWWLGGQQQGPPPPTNPIRQAIGNFVESVGNSIPFIKEGYLSETIAGGPTKKTGINAMEPVSTSAPVTIANVGANAGANAGQTISNMVSRGGYDENTARQVYFANPTKFENEFGAGAENRLAEERMRQESLINQGYDNYLSQLDAMLEGLPTQSQNLTGIIDSQYNQGVNTLGANLQTGLDALSGETSALQQNQAKNLRDLAENMRNMFMAGNVYLGSRGAGDSSAANQYSYALSKIGNRARGDVMNQTSQQLAEIGRRQTQLKTIHDAELANLQETANQKKLEVAQWFETQQNQIRQQKAEVGSRRAQDLAALSQTFLNQALQRITQIDQELANKRSMLDQWAISNSQNLQQLAQNLQSVAGYKAQLPSVQMSSGSPTISGGNLSQPIFWSNNQNKEEERFR